MKAAVWYGEKDIRIEDKQIKNLEPGTVKVKVAWGGICGSDLHAYLHPESVPIDLERTLGHEFSGVIEEVGTDVKNLKVGDRVCIYPMLFNDPDNALQERFKTLEAVGAQIDGGFAEYAVLPEKTIFKIPNHLPLDIAAMVEPAAVAYQGVEDAGVKKDDIVIVYGTGPIGLFTIAAAKLYGAKTIIAVDINQERLNYAVEMGADKIINSTTNNPIEEILEFAPNGADITFETAGVEETFNQATQSTKIRGTMMILSFFTENISINIPQAILFTGINVMGSVGYSHATYDKVINYLASGDLKARPIITHKTNLTNITKDGFERLLNNKEEAKILIQMNKDID